MEIPRLLLGLGNPTEKYTRTRHNIGRRFIEHLLDESEAKLEKNRQGEYFDLSVFFGVRLESPLRCLTLECFMNESGQLLKPLLYKWGIPINQTLVLSDDFMIPFGALRLRPSGSSGGHNGLKSIIDVFQTEDVPRLRMGIGPTPEGEDPAVFVLERFTRTQEEKLPKLFESTVDGLKILFENGFARAMDSMNKVHF